MGRDRDPERVRPVVGPETYEEVACEAAHRAGRVLRSAFRDEARVRAERKGTNDFVTELDREAERLIVDFLHRRFPDHGIMAEEGSPDAAAADFRWIVDPLDGTANFIHGVPTFAVSVAIEDASGLLAGAVHDPIHEETFHAFRGGGARLNGDTIRCSRPASLDECMIATGFPFRDLTRVRAYLRAFEAFIPVTAGLRRAGSASLDLAFTACGRYDGFWEVGLSRWDVAAGVLLVLESGGVVTDVAGGDGFLLSGDVVAAGPGVHAEMLRITKASLG